MSAKEYGQQTENTETAKATPDFGPPRTASLHFNDGYVGGGGDAGMGIPDSQHQRGALVDAYAEEARAFGR